MSPWVWMTLALFAAIYCLARGIADIRKRSYVWGLAGLVSGAVILLTPNPNTKVSVTIPIAQPAGAGR